MEWLMLMILQKHIPSLDISASEGMKLLHTAEDLKDDITHIAVERGTLLTMVSNYMLLYKEILYSKQFPHRKYIQENRTIN
jgi:hypothetical protein